MIAMGFIKKKKCKHCKMLFIPDFRNINHQHYCSKPECRKAGKKASQKRWLSKPENRAYFCGQENVTRVQQWRKNNPGYWKKSKNALQDVSVEQHAEYINDTADFADTPLQDSLIIQPAVIIGLIANITGLALQDDIAKTLFSLQQLGKDILNPITEGGRHDSKTSHHQKSHPENSQAVQLGRSQAGP
jgi:hypothetical protein